MQISAPQDPPGFGALLTDEVLGDLKSQLGDLSVCVLEADCWPGISVAICTKEQCKFQTSANACYQHLSHAARRDRFPIRECSHATVSEITEIPPQVAINCCARCVLVELSGGSGPRGEAMKRLVKFLLLLLLGTVLLALVHSHAREHRVPHPHVAKVSLAKRVVPRPQLPVVPAVVAAPAAEHPIAIGLVVTPGTVALLETEQSSCHLRGPPLVCPVYAG